MQKSTEPLKHPLRAAVIAWGAVSVFFLAAWPFTPFGSSFLALGMGIALSAFVVGVAVGMVLLTHKVERPIFWFSTAVLLLALVTIQFLLYWGSLSPENAGASLRVFGVVFWVIEIGLCLAIVAMTVASIAGWVRFFRKIRPSNSST